jgi:transposase
MLNYAMKHLFNTLSSTPDLYLDELQLELQEKHGVSVSIPTIWRTLKRGGYSMKKVHNITWWQVQH